MSISNNLIYLIGYMGCGKTTTGKAVAKKLGYTFIDMDDAIVAQTGKSINELFEIHGEQGFREIEKQYLHSSFDFKNAVISTGGGAPCFFDNIEQINLHGTSFYIKMSVGGLFNRLTNAKHERPLLKNLNDEELKAFIELNLTKREPFYSQAMHIVKGENLKPTDIIDLL